MNRFPLNEENFWAVIVSRYMGNTGDFLKDLIYSDSVEGYWVIRKKPN